VSGREPLWENPPDQPVVVGLRTDARDVLITHVLDAEPDHRLLFPEPSVWPFLTAITTTILFIWSIFTPWGVVYGAIPVFVTMVGWFWPKSPQEGGTPLWPFAHRTLPRPNEAPAAGGAI
jgi:cytochrome c oxidase subunit 1